MNLFPQLSELESILEDNPDIARWAVELQMRQAQSELARAQAQPNIKLSGGVKYFNESDGTAFVVGVGIPLRKSTRNRQLTLEAQSDIEKASQQHKE